MITNAHVGIQSQKVRLDRTVSDQDLTRLDISVYASRVEIGNVLSQLLEPRMAP